MFSVLGIDVRRIGFCGASSTEHLEDNAEIANLEYSP
jgi:hypothetical protein